MGFHLPSSQSASCITLYLKSGHLAFVCSKWNSIQHLSALQSSRSVRCMQITMLVQLLPPNQEADTDSFSSNHLSSRTFSDREHTYTWTATSSNRRQLKNSSNSESEKLNQVQEKVWHFRHILCPNLGTDIYVKSDLLLLQVLEDLLQKRQSLCGSAVQQRSHTVGSIEFSVSSNRDICSTTSRLNL